MMKNIDQLVEKVVARVLAELSRQVKNKIKVIGTLDAEKKALLTALPESRIWEGSLAEADLLLISELSLGRMARIANGVPNCLEEEEILLHFLTGKKALLIKEGIEFYGYRQTATYALRKKYEEFELQWHRFGTEIVSMEEGRVALPKELYRQNAVAEGEKKVLTERKVKELNLTSGSQLRLQTDEILTALAKDYLREKNIHWV